MTNDITSRISKQHLDFFDTTEDLATKLQFLVDYMDKCGYLDEHRFTFPDGDTWTAGE